MCEDGAVVVQRQQVNRTSIATATVVANGRGDHIDGAVAVEVTDALDLATERGVWVEGPDEPADSLPDLLSSENSTVRVEQQHDEATVVVDPAVLDADSHIRRAVTIDIIEAGDPEPELVAGFQRDRQTTLQRRDLLLVADRPISVDEQDRRSSGIDLAVVIERAADQQVREAIAVDVARRCHHGTPSVTVVDSRGEATLDRRDALFVADRAIGIEKQDVDGAPVAAATRSLPAADCDFAATVTIEIPHRCDAVTEVVARLNGVRQTSRRCRDLLLVADRTVCVQERDVDGTGVGASVIVAAGTDDQIVRAITVEVTDSGNALADLVTIGKRPYQPTDRR